MKHLLQQITVIGAKSILWIFPLLLVLIIAAWAVSLWPQYNPLAKYGISYEKTSGEHEEYQTITFYVDVNHQRVRCLSITNDDLYITFRGTAAPGEIPEVVVGSETYKDHFAVLKLILAEPGKPKLEVIENHMMGINVP